MQPFDCDIMAAAEFYVLLSYNTVSYSNIMIRMAEKHAVVYSTYLII